MLIQGDPRKEKLYTIAEVEAVTGLKRDRIHARRRAWGIPSARESGRYGYTYDEVVQMIRKPNNREAHEYSQARANELRARLTNDGYTVAK